MIVPNSANLDIPKPANVIPLVKATADEISVAKAKGKGKGKGKGNGSAHAVKGSGKAMHPSVTSLSAR